MTRRVLVTGGGTGIGKAIAQAFAAQNCQVTISGRRRGALEQAAMGTDLEIRPADVTDEAQVETLFDTAYDVVVANAGTGIAARIEDVELEDWQHTLTVNMTGTFLTFRAALRAGMKPGGRLIAIASTASLQGGAHIPAYAASKHGVLGLVRSVAQSVAKRGITCNAICPGFVDTEMAESAITGLMARHDIPREKALKMVVGGNPMQRLIAPAEVAATAVFLASDDASSINGHAMSVSGGEI
ncbi:SDR family NAD(P)-dependent oxidoreductase [Leisingera sp. M523]|uniref:SDR family NAD(P)-dependent oxidoreductase n=1 Tax=Leisingera sp. M523 TaxID=2867013 RepID=UPI0021A3CF79|nr:SDR family oxidoreductase [Leisingera sp. M523]UWQ27249.1 SDR family oxidoreductase [Leisingera sp. M523]